MRASALLVRPCLQEEAEAQQLLEEGYFNAGTYHEPHNNHHHEQQQQQQQHFPKAAVGQLSEAALAQMRE